MLINKYSFMKDYSFITHAFELPSLSILNIMGILVLLFISMAYAGELDVGDICEKDDQCGELMVCQLGRCACSPDANMMPVFSGSWNQLRIECHRKVRCDYTVRPRIVCDVGHCLLEKGEFYGLCGCGEDSMVTINSLYNETCWPYSRKNFDAICGNSSPLCDERKGLACRRMHCLCKPNYMYDFKAEECVSKEPFLKKFNLTEYKGRWGDYCSVDDECLELLECARNRTCECPRECYGYIKEHNACDCGDDDYYFPTGPVIVGVLGGILIIAFWCYHIDKLCKKYQVRPVEPISMNRYEGINSLEEEQSSTAPDDDQPPNYTSTMAADNSTAPSAPPAPFVDYDRGTVGNQPLQVGKRNVKQSQEPPAYEDVVKGDIKDSAGPGTEGKKYS